MLTTLCRVFRERHCVLWPRHLRRRRVRDGPVPLRSPVQRAGVQLHRHRLSD